MRSFRWFTLVFLLVALPNLVGIADTDTPTPTPTATSTATMTATATATPNLYLYGTLPADGQSVAVIYTITAGEALSGTLQLIIIGLLLMLVFLGMVRRGN